jgi:hypothetical protein
MNTTSSWRGPRHVAGGFQSPCSSVYYTVLLTRAYYVSLTQRPTEKFGVEGLCCIKACVQYVMRYVESCVACPAMHKPGWSVRQDPFTGSAWSLRLDSSA